MLPQNIFLRPPQRRTPIYDQFNFLYFIIKNSDFADRLSWQGSEPLSSSLLLSCLSVLYSREVRPKEKLSSPVISNEMIVSTCFVRVYISPPPTLAPKANRIYASETWCIMYPWIAFSFALCLQKCLKKRLNLLIINANRSMGNQGQLLSTNSFEVSEFVVKALRLSSGLFKGPGISVSAVTSDCFVKIVAKKHWGFRGQSLILEWKS